MAYLRSQRAVYGLLGLSAGAAYFLNARARATLLRGPAQPLTFPQRHLQRDAADVSHAWVSPPPPAAAEVRPSDASGSEGLQTLTRLQPPAPLLSAAHRAQLARSWNEGVDAAFGLALRELGKRGW